MSDPTTRTNTVNSPVAKRPRADDHDIVNGGGGDDEKDLMIAQLRSELVLLRDREELYYASNDCLNSKHTRGHIPESGQSARHVKERIVQSHELGTCTCLT